MCTGFVKLRAAFSCAGIACVPIIAESSTMHGETELRGRQPINGRLYQHYRPEADLRLPLNLRLDCGGCRCDRLAWGQNAGLHVGFGSLVPSVHEAAIFLLGRLEMELRNVTYCPPVARVCKDKTGKIFNKRHTSCDRFALLFRNDLAILTHQMVTVALNQIGYAWAGMGDQKENNTGKDAGSFQALFVTYFPKVQAILMRQGADRQTAEEIAQDTMFACGASPTNFRPIRGVFLRGFTPSRAICGSTGFAAGPSGSGLMQIWRPSNVCMARPLMSSHGRRKDATSRTRLKNCRRSNPK